MKKSIQRQNNIFVWILTILLVISLATCVYVTINRVNAKNRQYCFDDLASTSRNLAANLSDSLACDKSVLKAISEVLSSRDSVDVKDIIDAMSAFQMENSYVSYIQALLPDNTMLYGDGTLVGTDGRLDFDAEAKKGIYTSGKEESLRDPDDFVIRTAVPVVKNQETVCILYGVVSLSELAEKFTTDIYDGNAFVYLVDVDTGDFLLDTWHKTLGNIMDLSDRTVVSGKSFAESMIDLKNGISGNIVFLSRTTGGLLYLHYEPTDVNHWNIFVTVTEEAAFRRTQSISDELYIMAGVVALCFFVYLVCIISILFANYRFMKKLSTEDEVTKLRNRNAFETRMSDARDNTFAHAACIYIDVNGLHEINNKYGHATGDSMLLCVAESIRQCFPREDCYRVGGDEFVVLSASETEESCRKKIEEIHKLVEDHGYSVSDGLSYREDEKGFDRIIREADSDMVENKREFYRNNERRDVR